MPRLRWNCDLHNSFVQAVEQLGGEHSKQFPFSSKIIVTNYLKNEEIFQIQFFLVKKNSSLVNFINHGNSILVRLLLLNSCSKDPL